MNRFIKKTVCFLATLMLVFSFSNIANAQGTTSISVTKNSLAVGDSTTVSVSASSSGTVKIKYTASLMNFIDCTASGYSYEGNTITFSGTSGDIKFKAVAEGTASIIVSSSNCTGSSTTIAIGNKSASETSQDDATEQEEVADDSAETTDEADSADDSNVATSSSGTGAGTLNADGGFDIDGVSYVVSERFTESEIPSGFKKTSLKIGNSTYNELTNDTILLIYLKPADNTAGSGEFYIYSEGAGTVNKLHMLGTTKSYVMVANATEVLSGYMKECTLTTDSGDIPAYSIDGSEFYYVYGFNQESVISWYMYDSTYKTISRVDTSAFSPSSDTTEVDTTEIAETTTDYDPVKVYQKKLEKFRLIVSALIILCVVLLFIVINLALKRNKIDDEVEPDDIFSSSPRRASRKSPRSIVFEENTDDFEDDDLDDEVLVEDEEYEEDEDFDGEIFRESKSSKSKRATKNTSKPASKGFDMMDLNDL